VPERADAARNRRAILAAAEELLTVHRPDQVSVEQVAAAAGVGKGTVFHRFGSRRGLMVALAEQRAMALHEAVLSGPPPLGPGAPPRDRLLAFLDALVELVSRNIGLMAALDHATVVHRHEDDPPEPHPLHAFWQSHIAGLLAAARSDLDAELLAHVLLGGLRSDVVVRLLASGGATRLAAALRTTAEALLDAPPRNRAPVRGG
jgi:AcrR family transcriptional regulator